MKLSSISCTKENLALMLDIFASCIESRTLPDINSVIHHNIRWMVEDSGFKFKRKKIRLKYRRQKNDKNIVS